MGKGDEKNERKLLDGHSDMECATYGYERTLQEEIEECMREDTKGRVGGGLVVCLS